MAEHPPNAAGAKDSAACSTVEQLKDSFAQLSCGLDVSCVSSPAPTAVSERRASEQFSGVLSSLNDAIEYSENAIDSLERISSSKQSLQSSEEASSVSPKEISQLRHEMCALLDQLRRRIDTAHVMNQNLHAADIRIDNVRKAQKMAAQRGLKMPASLIKSILV